MSAQISVHGRISQDPQERTAASGKLWATGSMAVTIQLGRDDEDTLWLQLVAFGRSAEQLVKHRKGDMVSVMGSLQKNKWTGKDGVEKESWQCVVDALVSARSVRPGGRPKAPQAIGQSDAPPMQSNQPTGDFNDEVPF